MALLIVVDEATTIREQTIRLFSVIYRTLIARGSCLSTEVHLVYSTVFLRTPARTPARRLGNFISESIQYWIPDSNYFSIKTIDVVYDMLVMTLLIIWFDDLYGMSTFVGLFYAEVNLIVIVSIILK